MRFSQALAAGAFVAGASAQNYLGFNSGSTFADGSAKQKKDFLQEFTTAQNLENAPGKFNAIRLYTNIQAGTPGEPISAFEAAMETKTLLLLGIWTSGTDSIQNELTALKKGVAKYGKPFTDLIIGISIGSEDLYRNSVTGVANDAGIGNQPENIVRFINDYRKAVAGSALSSVPVGHVDTWDVWGNATNRPVLDAIDWVGVDEYPYYESGKGNTIENAPALFDRAYKATMEAVGGKPVWVTETGWPTTGIDWDQAHPSIKNAKFYWDEVGCRNLFNKVPTFWYTLRDANPVNKQKFAISENVSTKPYFDLSCPKTFVTPPLNVTGNSAAGSDAGNKGGNSGNGQNGGAAPAQNGGQSKPNGASSSSPFLAATYAGLAVIGGVFALF